MSGVLLLLLLLLFATKRAEQQEEQEQEQEQEKWGAASTQPSLEEHTATHIVLRAGPRGNPLRNSCVCHGSDLAFAA